MGSAPPLNIIGINLENPEINLRRFCAGVSSTCTTGCGIDCENCSNPMEKTTSICCAQNASEKDDRGGWLYLEDRNSGLPDVILVSILSLLTMKEAGRSSLLSKRWRYTLTYITALNFDASHIIYGLELEDKKLEVERPLYLSWVNQVLNSYNGPSTDRFRVQFDLNGTSRFDLDNWVIEQRVKRLDLDLINSEFNWFNFATNRSSMRANGIEFAKFPVFDKLKQLELKICVTSEHQSLLVFALLIEACPFLNKFVLQICSLQLQREGKFKVENKNRDEDNWGG
ncbi:putative F-box/LRR-repeat protein At3g18150 [Cornus florida]|uniref:putative F-box/LRR-repeat protein At3g18150 n=1 Tax=Cornus florida TaxID=4283 RepID=UPI00289B6BE9|nr:putative F-box/LRR-repeat protein At3g18150 [Cornus florida]